MAISDFSRSPLIIEFRTPGPYFSIFDFYFSKYSNRAHLGERVVMFTLNCHSMDLHLYNIYARSLWPIQSVGQAAQEVFVRIKYESKMLNLKIISGPQVF